MLARTIVASICVSSNAPKRKSSAPFLLAVRNHPAYYLQVLGLFLVIWVYYFPLLYL